MLFRPDIPYSDRGDGRLCVDLFIPEGIPCRATLIWFHGGGLEAGSRKDQDVLAEVLCQSGIAMVSVEYRMYPEAAFPDFLVDCAEAVRWARDHAAEYNLSGRLLVGGSSAGGYLTLMLCFDRQYLGMYGMEPEDIAAFLPDAGQPTKHFNVLKYGGEDSRRLIVDEAAPLYHIQDAHPDRPLLITVSDNDMPCRLEQNRLLYATLRHFQYDMDKVELHVMEGYSHCGYTLAKDADGKSIYGQLVMDFLNRHVFGA